MKLFTTFVRAVVLKVEIITLRYFGCIIHKKQTQRNVASLHRLPQKSWTKAGLCCDINCPPYAHNIATKSLSTVSTISSNYHPPLIDMNNNRRKLVNGEHNCPGQKAKRSRSHFTAGASRRRRLGCSQWAGRDISLQISILHLHHISLLGHPLNVTLNSTSFTCTAWYTGSFCRHVGRL